jgi:hypothetical protein
LRRDGGQYGIKPPSLFRGLSLGGWVAADLSVRDTRRLASLVGAAGLFLHGAPDQRN